MNSLNQYTQRTMPGAVDVIGVANGNATVTVNNRPSYRHGEYFRNEYWTNNSAGSNYLWLTNLAVLQNGTNADMVATNIGSVFLPKTPEIFLHDADGNLTNDGRWAYSWDAENRLTLMLASQNTKMWFSYDDRGRRISKDSHLDQFHLEHETGQKVSL